MSKDGLLALEVKIYGALADFRLLGHAVHGSAVKTVLKKNFVGRPEDGLPPFFLFPLAARSGRHMGTLCTN
jgi:hypothetical protein